MDPAALEEGVPSHPMRKLLALLFVVLFVAAGLFFFAGRLPGPAITVAAPGAWLGASTPLDVVVEGPAVEEGEVSVSFEQNGTSSVLIDTAADLNARQVTNDGDGRLRITHVVGRDNVTGLTTGPGRIVVTASRPVLFGLRQVVTSHAQDVTVRLDPPRVAVMSTHHFVNQGGAELVVYRVSPEDVESGVRVGDIEYPGYRASSVTLDGRTPVDPALRVAFFAVLHNQPLDTPIRLYARDPAGNESTAAFDARIFAKPFKTSRIGIDDAFMARVVPAILAGTDEVAPVGELVDQFLAVNGDLRRLNAERIASFATQTAPEMFWQGQVFHPFTNTAVQSAFADARTYVYNGREIDHQTHLGFDLASVAHAPIPAANTGRVLFAAELGIYGNCVIVDHGLGVQSLYAHLSSFSVSEGDIVQKGQEIGRTGTTGLAGGDHLHFTMLLQGQMINPIEWWDPKWTEDRVLRKLREIVPQ
jgi:murein DD-endopeptidase MepM/ murein hydrolase activator NlpD